MVALSALTLVLAGVSAWAETKPCCKKKAAQAAASDGRSETVGSDKAPCAHAAETTAQKTPCGKNCDENCKKNCPHAQARTVAMAEADKPSPRREKVSAVLASLPEMTYRVGDETTHCPTQAKELAAKGGTIQYVVGEETFDSEDAAVVRLASLIDEEVNKLQAVHFVVADEEFLCPMSAKDAANKSKGKIAYRVAGFDFAERAQADKVIELAKAAVDNVKMHYKVGDESFCCDKMAGAKAKETHKQIVYEIGGESTPCAVTAKRLMAEAKLRAVIETAAEQAGM